MNSSGLGNEKPQKAKATRPCGAWNGAASSTSFLLLPSSFSPPWSCYIVLANLLAKIVPWTGSKWEYLPSW